MKVSEAIRRADELRPNAVDGDRKAEWLFNLEGELAEMMRVEAPVNKYPVENQELLMPAPHDDIYPLYLCAMIDLAHEETGMYANDLVVANNAIADARKWWWRTHEPPQKKVVRNYI